MWPSTCWPRRSPTNGDATVQSLVESIKQFQMPQYDDTDRCEGCIPVKDAFRQQLDVVLRLLEKRLWGLCLDCYKSATGVNAGECRYEHPK